MVYIIFICFMIVLCSANGKEGKENETENLKERCKDLNLAIDVHADSEKCTIAVYFQLENSAHNNCCHFFDITLRREKQEVTFFRVKYDAEKYEAYHKFENVTSGVYEIFIYPVCSPEGWCPCFGIDYGKYINITSNICISNRKETYHRTSAISEIPTSSITNKIYPVSRTKEAYTSSTSIYEAYTSPPNDTKTAATDKAVTHKSVTDKAVTDKAVTHKSVTDKAVTHKTYESEYQNTLKQRRIFIILMTCILLLIICILIYLARKAKMQCLNRTPSITSNHKDNNNYVEQNTHSNIEVYIFHHYDRKGEMKKKVEVIKDFLLKLSYFSCVKGIEDELAVILFNVNNWLNDVLDESRKDGTVKRVILITSQEENEQHLGWLVWSATVYSFAT